MKTEIISIGSEILRGQITDTNANSIEIVLKCTEKYKLPVPVREAHIFVNQIRNNLALIMNKIES